MRTSPKTNVLMGAIAAIQKACPFVDKNKTADVVGHYKYKYATHDLVWDEVRGLCAAQGLVVVQGGREGLGASKWLVTRLEHVESEQWIETDLPMETAKAGMQALGAAISYCRRVALLASLGIVAKGDDTDAAGDYDGRSAKPPRIEKAARPANVPPDAAAIVERVLAGLPSLTTMGGIDEAVKEIRGIVPKELDGRVRAAFKAARERVQSATREPGSDG